MGRQKDQILIRPLRPVITGGSGGEWWAEEGCYRPCLTTWFNRTGAASGIACL